MFKILIFMKITLLSFLFSLEASGDVISPVVFAAKTNGEIVVDGYLNEGCWEKAVRINYFLDIYDNTKPASPQTYFQVLYDEERLYFGITGNEPDIENVTLEKFPRNRWPRGSSIEIFLDTNTDRTTYYQFATNLAGSIFDSDTRDTAWDGRWEVAGRLIQEQNLWFLEIAVPFEDFGISAPETGSEWGLNISRNREGGLDYSSTWAPVGGDFHNPGMFNTLIFGSFPDWMRGEIEKYRKLQRDSLVFLRRQETRERRLESKIIRSRALTSEVLRKRLSDSTDLEEILPVYEKINDIGVLMRDITDELKIINVLAGRGMK